MPFSRLNRCVLLTACALGFSAAGQAEPVIGDLGMALSYQPHDPSGSRYEARVLPYMDLTWGDFSLSSDDGLSWDALKDDGWSAGPFVKYVPGRNGNGTLRGLRDVSDMGEVGGFVQYSPADFWRVFAQVGQTVGGSDRQGGMLGRIGGELGFPLGLGVIGDTSVTANYADARQTQTFYGVSAQEAQASGISRYNASGGLQNVTLTQGVQFPLAHGWLLLTSASWIHLVGSAADSSIVKQKGNDDQGELNIAVAYHFKGL